MSLQNWLTDSTGSVRSTEWINAGARLAYVVEAFEGRHGVMRALIGMEPPAMNRSMALLINSWPQAMAGLRGFSDVVAFWDDGRISLQELKLSGKDALRQTQPTRRRSLADAVGPRAELSVLEWGKGGF